MTKKYDIKYAFRKYESLGEQKTYWTTHGTLWVDDNGKMKIKINSVPVVANYEGWYEVYEQEPKEPYQQRQQPKKFSKDSDSDDVPW
jgi:hypothetical protein